MSLLVDEYCEAKRVDITKLSKRMTAQPLELHSADIITHPSLPHLSLAKISKITLEGICICFLAEVKKLSVKQSIWNITRIVHL